MIRSCFTVAFFLLLATRQAHCEVGDREAFGLSDLGAMECVEVTRSRLVRRICYDEFARNMLVEIAGTYWRFCGVDRATAEAFLDAKSMTRYFAHARRTYGCASASAPD
jgi:hypothetical protein